VRIAVERLDDSVVLSVDDDGPGIAPEVLENVFEPFVTTKEAGKGTGLGLSVARDLAESAGGKMLAGKSELGGARLSMTLPLAQSELD
jgi:signal transduction histidine kinase